ncbi:MAG: OadG family protein [Veillonellaceae bacterium]|nr:OadG family protein [Veillonellaceae bacterium]
MSGHVVTTNPWLVMLINMTIVFGVLICLGILMKIIYWIDPTRKRSQAKPETISLEKKNVQVTTPEPKAAANNDEIVAVITAAIVAEGYSSDQIASIRPQVNRAWKLDGRMAGRNYTF